MLLYLCDWKFCLRFNKKLTDIEWRALMWPDYYDGIKPIRHDLLHFESEVVDFVINTTAGMSEDGLCRLINSTYPVIVSDRYEIMDLLELAKEYKRTKLFND